MDIFTLLDELQTIARNGLTYATNPYDIERYKHLMALTNQSYSHILNLPPADVQQKFAQELGYITPKVGAEAAIFNPQGQILLMLRADDNRWGLPGGWLDPNETPADTAIREAKEECGLEVRPLQLVDIFTRKPSLEYGPHTAVAIVYLCEITGGQLTLSHEGLELRYWSLAAVPVWHGLHQQFAIAAHAIWQIQQKEAN